MPGKPKKLFLTPGKSEKYREGTGFSWSGRSPAIPKTPPPATGTCGSRKKRTKILVAIVTVIVIIAGAAGGFVVMKNLQNSPTIQPEASGSTW